MNSVAHKGIYSACLDALTLRCFDLLDSIGNTGCLALARLNAEGITLSCEGVSPWFPGAYNADS